MGQRNDGQGEINALQNRFTAYLLTALKRNRCTYIKRKQKQEAIEFSVDIESEQFESEFVRMMADTIPFKLRPEYFVLLETLEQLSERERYILLETILYGSKYEELAKRLGLQYGGVAVIYHRVMKKLRKEFLDNK